MCFNEISVLLHLKCFLARKHFRWSNTEISLKHIFHQKKDVLDTIAPLIKNDLSLFDYYAKRLFKDKVLNNSGGHLGWVPYNTLDPNIEQVAFSMPAWKTQPAQYLDRGYCKVPNQDDHQNYLELYL